MKRVLCAQLCMLCRQAGSMFAWTRFELLLLEVRRSFSKVCHSERTMSGERCQQQRESVPSDHWQRFHSALCAGDTVSFAHLLCPSVLKTKGIWEVFCDRKKHGEGGHGLAMWLQPSVFSRKALEGAGVL